MEPIVLNFNEVEYDYQLKQVEDVRKKITPILKQVSAINGLEWTPELFNNFIAGNGTKVEAVIVKTAIQPLIKQNINSQTLLDEAANGDKAKYWVLYQAVKKVSNATQYVGNELLTVDQIGETVIPETAKEQLREKNTATIYTEKGKALYDAHTELIKICNTILELCGPYGADVIDEMTDTGYNLRPEKYKFELLDNYDQPTQQQ